MAISPVAPKRPRRPQSLLGITSRATPINQRVGSTPGVGGPGYRPPGTTTGPAASQPAGVGAPPPLMPAPQRPGPPPPSLEGQDLRINATGTYGQTVADVNRAILQAALAYGGVDQVDQFLADNDTATAKVGVAKDPNSMLAKIGRWLEDSKTVEGQNRNAGNTFFSGLHQKARADLDADSSRQQGAAATQFSNQLADLTSTLRGARLTRDDQIRAAIRADLAAAANIAPEPGPVAPPAAAPQANKLQTLINQYGGENVKLTERGLFYRRPSDGKWIPVT